MWSKGQGKTERGRRLEDQKKEHYLFVLTHLLEFLLLGNVCRVALTTTFPLPPNYVCQPYSLHKLHIGRAGFLGDS